MIQSTIDRTSLFLREVREELRKVTWPTWTELKGQTLVVIIAVLIIAAFIGVVDIIVSNIMQFVLTSLS